MAKTRSTFKGRPKLRAHSFRSGLEEKVSKQLEDANVPFEYEFLKLRYVVPEKEHTYTPDFRLHNGIIVETKGLFDTDDRKKMVLVKEQHPNLDIRMVFQNASSKIRKGSRTSYADWSIKEGFKWADHGRIPEAWLIEASKKR